MRISEGERSRCLSVDSSLMARPRGQDRASHRDRDRTPDAAYFRRKDGIQHHCNKGGNSFSSFFLSSEEKKIMPRNSVPALFTLHLSFVLRFLFYDLKIGSSESFPIQFKEFAGCRIIVISTSNVFT